MNVNMSVVNTSELTPLTRCFMATEAEDLQELACSMATARSDNTAMGTAEDRLFGYLNNCLKKNQFRL